MMTELIQLIADVKNGLRDEWGSRTLYGKLVFPLWLLQVALIVSVVGGVVLLGKVMEVIGTEPHEPLMEVYKDDE